MRDLAIITFQTLDGVMQAPAMPDEDRTGGFERGGWAAAYWPEVMEQVQREAMAAPYDMLLGRKTYELFAAHWPEADSGDPVADRMNRAIKLVASNSLKTLSWRNSRLVSGDVPTEIAALKEQDGPLIQVHGSSALIQSLLAHDLIDEFRLWTFPVIAGGGKCLFADPVCRPDLRLVKTERTAGGVVMGIYRRVT